MPFDGASFQQKLSRIMRLWVRGFFVVVIVCVWRNVYQWTRDWNECGCFRRFVNAPSGNVCSLNCQRKVNAWFISTADNRLSFGTCHSLSSVANWIGGNNTTATRKKKKHADGLSLTNKNSVDAYGCVECLTVASGECCQETRKGQLNNHSTLKTMNLI